MTAPNLLLTGSTGYLGFRTLIEALNAGYTVRAAVRSKSRAESTILSSPSIKALAPGPRLTFVEVPDITTPDAFKDALEGIAHIIHVASPLPYGKITDNFEEKVVKPAVEGTLSILTTALSFPSIKRIVITSSVVALLDPTTTDTTISTAQSRVPTPQGPFPDGRVAYRASKVAALNATDDFISQRNPHFSIVNIMPSFITGDNELLTPSAEHVTDFLGTTGAFPIAHLVYPEKFSDAPIWGAGILVTDSAKAHVNALDENRVKGHDGFIANVNVKWEDGLEVVKKLFSKAVEEGIFKEAKRGTLPALLDAGNAEDVLGVRYKGFEEMVGNAGKGYLRLVGREDLV